MQINIVIIKLNKKIFCNVSTYVEKTKDNLLS